ncbi:MAG: polymer-forming cytoskeletal protein [Desulfobacterales bacterium]|jgi:cytoskeletal protein CcmA (bactofilin family)
MFFNVIRKLFLKEDEKNLKEQIGPAITVIAPGTEIKGSVKGRDTLRISGYLEGNIDSERMVWVDQNGRIEGNIAAQDVINEGRIMGDIDCGGRVEIRSNGKMIGNIRAAKIMIAQGCLFEGEARIRKRAEEPTSSKNPNSAKLGNPDKQRFKKA